MSLITFIAALAVLACYRVDSVRAAPTFTIANDRFVKDGEEFLIFSGCIHYSRVHPGYWKDRLTRLRAMGLNAIETCE